MIIDVEYEPKFRVPFNSAQLLVLTKASRSHYDLVCRKMADTTFAMWRRIIDNGFGNLSATWDDLDIACKVLENTYEFDREEVTIANALTFHLHRAMDLARERIMITSDQYVGGMQ